MIVFSGLGLLIPVFYFAGMIPTMLLCTALRMDFAKSFALSTWAGAVMVLLFAKTIGRRKERLLLDPQTGRYVQFVSSHTIFFMGGMVWAVLAAMFALYLSILALRVNKSFVLLDEVHSPSPGETQFIAADSRLAKPGALDFGNTADAEKLAEGISRGLKVVRITSTDKKKNGVIEGSFVTACHLRPGACVFLVHSPELGMRTPDEMKNIKDATWILAQFQCSTLNPKPVALLIAVRGPSRYESVWIGEPAPMDPGVTPPGVKQKLSGSGKAALYPYYETVPGELPKLADKEDQISRTMDALRAELREEAKAAAARKSTPPASPSVPKKTPALPTVERDWKSSDGRPLHAALLRVTNDAGGSGVFRRTDGQEFTIPFVKFAPEDQTLLKTFVPPTN